LEGIDGSFICRVAAYLNQRMQRTQKAGEFFGEIVIISAAFVSAAFLPLESF